MSLLLVVGLTNLVWMIELALLLLAEKCWRHGVGLTVGGALIALGLLIVAHPEIPQSVAGGATSKTMR